MRAFLSLLLSLALILSPAGPLSVPAAAGGAGPRDVGWQDMQYVHCDGADFFQGVDQLVTLAGGADTDAVMALYDRLYEQFCQIDTLSSIAYIHSSADVTDEYWSAESQYSDALRYDAADRLSIACYQITRGPCAEAFAAHVGQSAFDAFAGYVPMTARETQLLAREAELVDEYYQKMNDAGQVQYDYLGTGWDAEMLQGVQGHSLALQDYDGYLEVYYGLQQAVCQIVGPIYLELVQLRSEIARIEGWDNYASLAYDEVYGRDYSQEDAQTLCDAVKAIARQYNEQLYASGLWYASDAVSPLFTPEQLLELLGTYTARLDPILEEPFRFMTEHGLYDLSAGPDRSPGAFTITLSQYDSAFIFATPGASYDGLSTLCHEFGHFTNDYYRPIGNILTDVPCYDLLEIHSTGLDTLMTTFYGEIFDQGADAARFNVLADLIQALIDGCIFDEFQRRIYAQPDMTLDEINRLFASICSEYGETELRDVDYAWIYIPHNFESPLYYLSYAASSLAAIQLWDMAQTDLSAAVGSWKALLEHDAGTEGYMSVLPACGLRVFTQEGAVEDICRPLLEELTRLSAGA